LLAGAAIRCLSPDQEAPTPDAPHINKDLHKLVGIGNSASEQQCYSDAWIGDGFAAGSWRLLCSQWGAA